MQFVHVAGALRNPRWLLPGPNVQLTAVGVEKHVALPESLLSMMQLYNMP
jgi:hypothetical protein